MALSDEAKKRLARFPVTDLAHAIARNPTAREAGLRQFLKPVESYIPSYGKMRRAVAGIYGTARPLDPSPTLTWNEIKRAIEENANPLEVDLCLEAAQCLFDFVRPMGFQAYDHEPQLLRVQPGRYIPIDIDCYLVDGDRLRFHFVNPRKLPIPAAGLTALASIVHHRYATGDYASAEVSIVDLSPVIPNGKREPRLIDVPRDRLLSLEALTAQVSEVYTLLERIAGEGPPRT